MIVNTQEESKNEKNLNRTFSLFFVHGIYVLYYIM